MVIWKDPRRAAVEAALDTGAPVLLLVSRAIGADLPATVEGEQVVLRFGRNLSPAIADLELFEGHLQGTLTFGGVPHLCRIPYLSVVALASEPATTAPQPAPPKPRHLKAV